MDMVARVFCKPPLDGGCLVRPVVLANEMDVETGRHGRIDGIESDSIPFWLFKADFRITCIVIIVRLPKVQPPIGDPSNDEVRTRSGDKVLVPILRI